MSRSKTGYMDLIALVFISTGFGIIFNWKTGLGILFIMYGIG